MQAYFSDIHNRCDVSYGHGVLEDEPTVSLDTERTYVVVMTFDGMVHEQNRAGIMVAHDLRMCEYVDRVLLMQDGKLTRVISKPKEIKAFAQGADA